MQGKLGAFKALEVEVVTEDRPQGGGFWGLEWGEAGGKKLERSGIT